MTIPQHLQLLLYSFVTWLAFYLFGLPDYYQHWYFGLKVIIVLVVTGMYFPMTRYTLKTFWADDRYLVNSCWLALYLTLPLFVYDYLLLGWYKGLGIGFVQPYWYLTFFYFSFWIQFPYIGWKMHRSEPRSAIGSEAVNHGDR
ncbi:hypothetical protein N9N28_17090 [Rubripirellula amarantea]|nr:hypothetical protein [Rubripirellula amarantea]